MKGRVIKQNQDATKKPPGTVKLAKKVKPGLNLPGTLRKTIVRGKKK